MLHKMVIHNLTRSLQVADTTGILLSAERSEFVTQICIDNSLLSPALECAALSPSPSPLEWILDPSKPRTLNRTIELQNDSFANIRERVLSRMALQEAKETNTHLKTDRRISWIAFKWAFEGVYKPHVAATYRVLGVHPELVWNHILADRQAKLAGEFSDWFDASGMLRPDVPKKQSSPVSSVPSPKKERA